MATAAETSARWQSDNWTLDRNEFRLNYRWRQSKCETTLRYIRNHNMQDL